MLDNNKFLQEIIPTGLDKVDMASKSRKRSTVLKDFKCTRKLVPK